ncbi:MAG: hypothetical protein AAGC44_08070 [Planctomycetota bacterium]
MNKFLKITVCVVIPLLMSVAMIIVIWLTDRPDRPDRPYFPDGIEIVTTDPYSKLLISREFYFNFSGDRSDIASNILIASFVEWAERQENYIFGLNHSTPNSKLNNLSPNSYFLIDYPHGKIYYLDKKTLDTILNGFSPDEIGITPQVRFTKVKQ